jgi:2-polyprenyl-3-methyl-5-hydroxy-6-metoxy-1,4-benzoquinol methylase
MRALAIADGEGRNGVWLAEQGAQVHAIDVSPFALEKAKKLAAERGVALDIEQADVLNWTWPEAAYDLVAAIFVQFATPAVRERMFAGMLQTLRPGGLLLLQGYTPRQLEYRTGGPPCAEHLYTPQLLRDAFAAHEMVEWHEHDDVLAEGTQHAGMSALIDCVVRRR